MSETETTVEIEYGVRGTRSDGKPFTARASSREKAERLLGFLNGAEEIVCRRPEVVIPAGEWEPAP